VPQSTLRQISSHNKYPINAAAAAFIILVRFASCLLAFLSQEMLRSAWLIIASFLGEEALLLAAVLRDVDFDVSEEVYQIAENHHIARVEHEFEL
jgi:hypothetical protein